MIDIHEGSGETQRYGPHNSGLILMESRATTTRSTSSDTSSPALNHYRAVFATTPDVRKVETSITSTTLFDRHFAVVPTQRTSASPSYLNQEILVASAAILFNMALAHHREGLDRGNSNSLVIALELYQRAYSTVEGCVMYFPFSDSSACLLAAICNNSAQIHAGFFNMPETRQWVDLLRNVLNWPGCMYMHQQDFIFFYMALLFFEADGFKIAPAA